LSLQSPLEFKVKVDVRPTFTLGQVDGIEIERFETEATDQDIDNSLKEIANQKRAIRKVEEPAQDGDFVKVDLAFHDEAGAKVHERKGVQLNTRIPVAGTDPDQFAKAIVGATSGKGIELPLTFPDNFEKDAFRGHKGTARLQVHEVLRITAPPVDDALAKALDFASLAALRSDLQRRIGDEKRRLGKQQQEETVLQTLLQAHTFDLPQSLVDEQARQSLAQFAERLKQSGANDADIEKQLEDSKAEAQTDAQRRVRLFFLIDAVARREKLFVTEGDVDTEVKNIAQQNQATPAQVLEHLEQHQQLGELRLALLERKVRDFLTGRAKIVDRKGK